jgi:hypothetical protein
MTEDKNRCAFLWTEPMCLGDVEDDSFYGRFWPVAARITPTAPTSEERVLLYGGQIRESHDFQHELRLITYNYINGTITVTTPNCTPPREGLNIVAGHRALFTNNTLLVFGGVGVHSDGKYIYS